MKIKFRKNERCDVVKTYVLKDEKNIKEKILEKLNSYAEEKFGNSEDIEIDIVEMDFIENDPYMTEIFVKFAIL